MTPGKFKKTIRSTFAHGTDVKKSFTSQIRGDCLVEQPALRQTRQIRKIYYIYIAYEILLYNVKHLGCIFFM